MSLKRRYIVVLASASTVFFLCFAAVFFALWHAITPEEQAAVARIFGQHSPLAATFVVVLLVVASLAVYAAFRWLLIPARRIEDSLRIIRTSNPAHRIEPQGSQEMRRIAEAVNGLGAAYRALIADVDRRFAEANARLAEERNRLAALMSDLPQSVLVCNSDGVILLYNARAKRLLDPPGEDKAAIGGAFIGLGRSIFSLLDRSGIAHALDSVQQKLAQQSANPSATFVMTRGDAQLLRASLAPVLDDNRKISGFVLLLDDVTLAVEASSRRDALLRSLQESTRGSIASIRAAIETMLHYPEMDAARRARFAAIINDEATKLSRWLTETLATQGETAGGEWSFEDMQGGDLLAALRRRLADVAVQIEEPPPSLWLRVDSYAVISALAGALNDIGTRLGDNAITLSMQAEGRFARFAATWRLSVDHEDSEGVWENWQAENKAGAFNAMLEHHGGEAWFKADRSRQLGSFFVQLPLAKAAPAGAAASEIPSRPEYYDFDLFNQPGQRPELDARRLADLSYTAFDTETTGLNPSQGDEIISIGAVRIVNGRLLRHETFEQLVDPRRPVPREAVQIHGITGEMLAGQPTIDQVLPSFHRFAEDTVLVAHNAAFDMRFLQLKEAETGVRFIQPVLDTLLLAAVAQPSHGDMELSLEALAARLGIDMVGRHTALGDALVTGEVLLKLLPLLANRGVTTLKEARDASQKTLYAKMAY